MRKTRLAIATAVLTLGLGVPFARADWASELEKDRRQYEEARRDGDLKGMENERREIEKDMEGLRREGRLGSRYPWGRGSYDRYDGWRRGSDDDYRYGRDYDRGYWHWHDGDRPYRRDRGNHYGWYKHGHDKHYRKHHH